ncbi:MAG: ATP-binding protein [Pseudomonadota bacterium]
MDTRKTELWNSVDALAAGIAHEINNPLGIIAQEAELASYLLQTPTLQDNMEVKDCRDSLREISRQVDRCREIIGKLLNLARQRDPVFQRTDVNGLIEEMTNLVAMDKRREKIVRIVKDIQPRLPVIQTDPPLLRQVILNLLNNGIQAIENEGTVCIATVHSGDGVEISITDTGCGISTENLKKIFTPFFTTKPQGQGTGLGLAICRAIVERLGGVIKVSSEPGRCTAFTVRLPIEGPLRGER